MNIKIIEHYYLFENRFYISREKYVKNNLLFCIENK